MGKVEDALRDLIYYHGKRAAKEVLGELPGQVRDARRTLRDVQSSVEELTAQVRELNAARKRDMAVPPAEEEQVERARFDRRTLKRVRRRFDLTQEELAELLEVSPVTVTSWETAKSRPRKSNLAQIIAQLSDNVGDLVSSTLQLRELPLHVRGHHDLLFDERRLLDRAEDGAALDL